MALLRCALPSLAAGFVGLYLVAPARAQEAAAEPASVVVVSAYPEQMTTRFQDAFEHRFPGVHVRFVWKQRRDAYQMLSQPDNGGADVYWAASPENYRALADIGAFQHFDVDRNVLPGRIGGQWISDPGGAFEAAEIAGYGYAVNLDILKQRGLPQPKTWRDLASPAYFGLIALPIAARVGFSPLLYDIILQSEGWAPGWALLGEIAANANPAFSGGAPAAAVESGEAAAGLSIDFFAASAAANGAPVAMVYPIHTAFAPAHLAMTAHAPHPVQAHQFIDFLLSREGQLLLLHPDIGRHPVRLDAYEPPRPGVTNPFAVHDELFPFNGDLARLRRDAVVTLFDVVIAERLDELKKLWPLIHAAEAPSAPPALRAAAARARDLASFVPMTPEQASDPGFLARFASPDFSRAQADGWRLEIARARAGALEDLSKAAAQ